VSASVFGAALAGSSGATFSEDRLYRYSLWRIWDEHKPRILFLMLNPSTADETTNDPTVERCQRRAVKWGFGGLYVGNIFAFRSTDPRALYKCVDPIGRNNDYTIGAMIVASELVVCGWGEHGAYLSRGLQVRIVIAQHGKTPFALKVNKSGQPAHPLYIPYSAEPVEYNDGK
jgi:hypothetical protein